MGMTNKYIEYSGMSYEQASREAARQIERLGWFRSFDRLTELHAIMDQHLAIGRVTRVEERLSECCAG
jgi:hypothetical protein